MAWLALRPEVTTTPEFLVPTISFVLIGVGSGVWLVRRLRRATTRRTGLVLWTAYLIAVPIAILATFLGAQALTAIPGLSDAGSWLRWGGTGLVSTAAGLAVFGVALSLVPEEGGAERDSEAPAEAVPG